MRPGLLALLVSSALTACAGRTRVSAVPATPAVAVPATPAAAAVTARDIQQEFQPDRPDVANGAHVVPVGLLQIEAGGQWADRREGDENAGVPVSFRLGVRNWLEARVESFGDLYESLAGQATGLGGLSTGVKIGFAPSFAIAPAVQLPVGTQTGSDYLLTLITGADFGDANHVDANYGMAAVSADPGHYFQQWVAVSANRQVTDQFSPYAEIYWYSHQDRGGPHVLSTDFGFIYTVNERFAFDCGADLGLTSGAPRARLFAGLSVIAGETFGHKGVHGRLKAAAERHAERSR